ncbi:MSCRAMM family protein [Scatolibacter rhodanostii]|uniref:MSCRAMM family protein n=1 Tax=Scatolibacter rhodanostii TaxID=2014781 RepID=UPI000C070398|nr:SpaA isopeptide-forming pilin-related protein [Scatolibacter rhodanostii]
MKLKKVLSALLCLMIVLQLPLSAMADSGSSFLGSQTEEISQSNVSEKDTTKPDESLQTSSLIESSLQPETSVTPEETKEPSESEFSSTKPEKKLEESTSSAESSESSSELSEDENSITIDISEWEEVFPYDNSEEFLKARLFSRAAASVYTVYQDSNGVQFIGQDFSDGHNETRWYPKRIHETGAVTYCVEHGVPIPNAYESGYTPREVTDDQYQRVSLADYYGRTTRGGDSLKNEYMVQLYVWEMIQGVRVTNLYYVGHPDWAPWVSMSDYVNFKREIQPKIDAFFRYPSFNGQNIKIKPGQSITLTDTNGVVASYENTPAINTTGLDIRKSGNSLILTANANSKNGYFTFRYILPPDFYRGTPIYYDSPNTQDVTVLGSGDPGRIRINVEVEKQGTLRIKKTSDEGFLAGFRFEISGDGKYYTGYTGADGYLNFTLPSTNSAGNKISYTAKEIGTPARYVQPNNQTFTIEPSGTTNLSFNNTLKRSSAKIKKSSEDGLVEGVQFRITGGTTGESFDLKTDKNGEILATLRIFDKAGSKVVYTATEINVGGRYSAPASQTFTLNEGQTVSLNFQNNTKKGAIRIAKTSEDGALQGFQFKITSSMPVTSSTYNGYNYLAVYDYQYYIDHNPDVKSAYGGDRAKTLEHFALYGIAEGRRASANFDPVYYKNNHADLRAAYGGNWLGYYQHYINAGEREGRKASDVGGNGSANNCFTVTRSTNASGVIDVSSVPVYDIYNNPVTYIVEEINTPSRFNQPTSQSFTIGVGQTKTVNFYNSLKNGNLKLIKTSEDGVVANLKFNVSGGGQTFEKVTNDKGELDVTGLKVLDSSNKQIVYTATEVSTPLRYLTPVSQTFTLQAGQTATLKFDNKFKRSSMQLIKTSEDNVVANLKFEITGNGQKWDKVTGADGKFDVSDMQVFDTKNEKIVYTATEVDTPIKYVQPAQQTFTLEYSKVTTVNFDNRYKRSSMQLVKTSEDDVVANLKFEITGNGQKWDKVTGLDGKFGINDMQVYDTKNQEIIYTIKEVSTPTKYVQPQQQIFTLKYGKLTEVKFDNCYKRSSMQLIKTSEDNVVANLKFKITGNGQEWDKVTDKDGKFDVSDMQVFDTNNVEIVYTINEVDTPIKYVQPAQQTFTLEYGKVTTVNFDNRYKRSSMQLVKTSEDDVVANLKFKITGNGQEWDKVTDKDGKFDVSDMQVFDTNNVEIVYTINEVDTPIKYVQPQEQTFTLEYNRVTKVYFYNSYKRADFQLMKESEDGIIAGLKFQVLGNNQQWEKTTDKDGKFDITDMQVFDTNNKEIIYTVREVDTPTRYVQPLEQKITLAYGKTTTVNFSNVLQRADLKVVKIAEDGMIEGLEFRITSSDGEIDIVRKTDKNGEIVVPDLRVFDKDNVKIVYTAEEINVPEKYIKPEPQKITLNVREENKAGKTAAIKKVIENIETDSQLTTLAVPHSPKKQTPEDEQKENPKKGLGISLQLTPLSVSVPGKLSSKQIAPIDLSSLLPESSKLESVDSESSEPESSKLESEDSQKPEQSENSEESESSSDLENSESSENPNSINIMKFENILIRGKVQTFKVDSENPDNKLTGTSFAVYADIDNDEIYTEQTDIFVGILLEDKDSKSYSLPKLTRGKYFIHESEPPEGFVQDENYYPFEITQDGELIEFNVPTKQNFPNDPIKGTIEGKKLTDNGKGLGGALIGLYKSDTTEITKETAIMTAISADDGSFYFANVLFGQYKVKELTAPHGYKLSDKVIDVDIVENEQVISIEIINKKIPDVPIPQTGDDRQPLLFIVVGVLSAAGIVTLLIRRKKRLN